MNISFIFFYLIQVLTHALIQFLQEQKEFLFAIHHSYKMTFFQL